MLPRGELTERLIFECDDTSFVKGVATKTPRQYARAWAKQRPLRGYERLSNERVQSPAAGVFEMDLRSDVKPQHRVLWRGLRMEIDDVQHDRAAWTTTTYCTVRNG
jgi:head-tail adaptor